jgi:WhiB family redox-sensing transcriptional regulator
MPNDDLSVFDCEPAGEWVREGACRGVDTRLFFPNAGTRPLEALAICASCSVRVECAEYAMDTHQHWGVWGGLTERQRFTVKRFRRSGVVHPLDPQATGDL